MEKQLHHYYEEAHKSDLTTGAVLVIQLEKRLDNIVYRIGFANSIRLARQLVNHGHILVNGKKVDIPSYQVKVGDVVSMKEKSRNNEQFKACFLGHPAFNLQYIEKNTDEWTGKLARMPERAEVPIQVNDQLVVEFYSK